MPDGDPHNRSTRIQNTVENIKTSKQISEENTEFILNFKRFLESQNLALDTTSRYLYSAKRLAENIDWNLSEPTKDKYIDLVGDINQSEYWGKDLTRATKAEYRKVVRKMAEFLESKKDDFDKDEMTDFFTVTAKSNLIDPEELPKPRHVAQLVSEAKRLRDSSLMMLLWASSARISSVLGVKYRDLSFHSDIATVKFRDTKTGDDRKVPVASAYPYLKQHKENDSGSEPDNYVFRSLHTDKQLSYNAVRGIIDRAAKDADIPDKIRLSPHNWRRGRISDLLRKGYSNAMVSKISGHAVNSEKLKLYARLSVEDASSAIRQEAGLKQKQQKEEDPLKPKKCPKDTCSYLNKFEAEQCRKCGEPLQMGELFKQVKEQEAEQELRKEVVEQETEWTNDKLQEKAKEIVKGNEAE